METLNGQAAHIFNGVLPCHDDVHTREAAHGTNIYNIIFCFAVAEPCCHEVFYAMHCSRRADGREMYGGRLDLVATIKANGDALTDFGGTVKCVVKNHFPNVDVTSSGDLAVVPVEMKVGDTLPDAHCVVDVSGIQFKVDLTDRTVLRREILATPAGSFDCVVVREHRRENGPMHHNEIWTDTWYAPDIGYVRHDHFSKKLRLESSEILVREER